MSGAMKSGVLQRVSGNMFTIQQDRAPAHRGRDTIELLRRSTSDFIASDRLNHLSVPRRLHSKSVNRLSPVSFKPASSVACTAITHDEVRRAIILV